MRSTTKRQDSSIFHVDSWDWVLDYTSTPGVSAFMIVVVCFLNPCAIACIVLSFVFRWHWPLLSVVVSVQVGFVPEPWCTLMRNKQKSSTQLLSACANVFSSRVKKNKMLPCPSSQGNMTPWLSHSVFVSLTLWPLTPEISMMDRNRSVSVLVYTMLFFPAQSGHMWSGVGHSFILSCEMQDKGMPRYTCDSNAVLHVFARFVLIPLTLLVQMVWRKPKTENDATETESSRTKNRRVVRPMIMIFSTDAPYSCRFVLFFLSNMTLRTKDKHTFLIPSHPSIFFWSLASVVFLFFLLYLLCFCFAPSHTRRSFLLFYQAREERERVEK